MLMSCLAVRAHFHMLVVRLLERRAAPRAEARASLAFQPLMPSSKSDFASDETLPSSNTIFITRKNSRTFAFVGRDFVDGERPGTEPH
jgi:hypothetical protein